MASMSHIEADDRHYHSGWAGLRLFVAEFLLSSADQLHKLLCSAQCSSARTVHDVAERGLLRMWQAQFITAKYKERRFVASDSSFPDSDPQEALWVAVSRSELKGSMRARACGADVTVGCAPSHPASASMP